MGEATTPLLDKFIAAVKADTGPATARTCRSIISGVMGLAVRYGAIAANPVREIERIEVVARNAPCALTQQERLAWLKQLRADETAVNRDASRPDLLHAGHGRSHRGGARGALVAGRSRPWPGRDHPHTVPSHRQRFDPQAHQSRAGERVLPLPASAVAILRQRFDAGARPDQTVLRDSIGGFRDPSNVRRSIREARGDQELARIAPHNFRKTTATILDEAALSARQVVDQLGHSRPAMTQDVHMNRRAASPLGAEALEQALRDPDEEENRG